MGSLARIIGPASRQDVPWDAAQGLLLVSFRSPPSESLFFRLRRGWRLRRGGLGLRWLRFKDQHTRRFIRSRYQLDPDPVSDFKLRGGLGTDLDRPRCPALFFRNHDGLPF